jgi:hypothetical protein
MSYLTRLPGAPDRDDIKPGMAFYEGTGPAGAFCGNCQHRGYWRAGRTVFNEQTGMLEEKSVHCSGCALFLKFTHRHGPEVKKEWKACKYHQRKQS